MISNALKTLLHPFETGLLPMPAAGARVLFLGARPGFRVPDGFDADLSPVQGFRPDFLALQREGFAASPEPQGDGYDLALVLAGRHRGENELCLAEAIARVKPDGLIVIAGDKTDGVASLRQRLEKSEDSMAAAVARKHRPPGIIVAEPEVGEIYEGTVVKTADFGAFVNFFGPRDGLVHISQLASDRVAKTTDVVKEGDKVFVKLMGFDERGKVRLSMKVVDQTTGKELARDKKEASEETAA